MRFTLPALLTLMMCSVGAEVVTETVTYSHGDVTLEGHLAYDDAVTEPHPGVLVVHEWWGINDYARGRAEQLAAMGYVAFALDMYGDGVSTDSADEARQLSGEIRGSGLLRERAQAGLDALAASEHVDASRLAAIGFCFGGTTALELAYSGADLRGAVSFHGNLPTASDEDQERLQAAILVCHGAADTFVSPDSIAAFQGALEDAGADWQMISYSGAVHSFTNPGADGRGMSGVAYDERAATRAWAHMRQFFDEVFAP